MDRDEISELLETQQEEIFTGSLSGLKDTKAQVPIEMHDDKGVPTHWFVPFAEQEKVHGFAILTKEGKIVSYGKLTPNAAEKVRLGVAFFKAIPAVVINEIIHQYPNATISSQSFSYDQSPQRWAWRLVLLHDNKQKVFFITPSGWYKQRVPQSNREGG